MYGLPMVRQRRARMRLTGKLVQSLVYGDSESSIRRIIWMLDFNFSEVISDRIRHDLIDVSFTRATATSKTTRAIV
jgi:hypothetical protein